MLNKPNSICVSGQFVYVTNSGGCYVSVFTTTGDYVTSFGRDDNEFSHLIGITVDSNNFIFITDSYGVVYQLKNFMFHQVLFYILEQLQIS